MDFVRFLHAPLLATLLLLILVFLVSQLIKKGVSDNQKPTVNQVRNVLALLLFAVVGWLAFTAATVNEAPRKAIDRSVVDERADAVRKQGREAEEAAKKRAAQDQKSMEVRHDKP